MEDEPVEPSVETLAVQVGAFWSQDRSAWPAAARIGVAQEIGRIAQQLLGVQLDMIREVDRDQVWREEGFSSAESWVANTCGVTEAEAKRRVRSARLLHEQDLTRKHFDVGDLNAAQIEELARVHEDREAQYTAGEAELLRDVMRVPPRTLRKTMIRWAKQTDGDKAPSEPDDDHSWFHASRTFNNFLRTDGLFTPEDGDIIEAALRDAMTVPAVDDRRKTSQRKGEAVVDIFSGKKRVEPHIDVRVDLDVLAGRRVDLVDGLCDIDPHGPAGRSMIETLLCDCAIGRVLMQGKSQVIDVGLQTRVIPTAMRRALNIRDGGCRYPGCGRHHSMCDAHHIIPWEHDGPTTLDNLILLCRRHHVHVHKHKFVIDMHDDGTVDFEAQPP